MSSQSTTHAADPDRITLRQKKGTWKRFIRLFPKCRLPWVLMAIYLALSLGRSTSASARPAISPIPPRCINTWDFCFWWWSPALRRGSRNSKIDGLSAKAEGRGKKRSSVYIVLGILLAVLTAIELVLLTPSLADDRLNNSLLSVIISIAVDATVLFAELDLVISAIRIRKIEKTVSAKAGSGEVR